MNKLTKHCIVWIGLLMAGAVSAGAQPDLYPATGAGDNQPPSWRDGNGTTRQNWTFDTDARSSTSPSSVNNQPGSPTATIAVDANAFLGIEVPGFYDSTCTEYGQGCDPVNDPDILYGGYQGMGIWGRDYASRDDYVEHPQHGGDRGHPVCAGAGDLLRLIQVFPAIRATRLQERHRWAVPIT